MRVFVTGGTGDLGRRLVPRLEKAGHEVVVGTRVPRRIGQIRYDLSETPSLDGFDVVVHLAATTLQPAENIEGSDRLWDAARRAGVAHTVYISIVGVDDHPYPYYRAKAEVERRLEASGLAHTILRATQFHGLIPRFINEIGRRMGFLPVPSGIDLQPVDADIVAERLAEIVEQGPSGRVDDIGGPEVVSLDEMVDNYRRAAGLRWPQVRVPAWGGVVDAFRDGTQLAPHVVGGGRRYEDFLTEGEFSAPSPPADPLANAFRVVSAVLFVTMAWMLLSPAGFHRSIAGFGDGSVHFVRDTATFILPLAVALWAAATRPKWRGPVLGLALLQNGAHLVNHLADVANADPFWHGPANVAAVVVLQLALWQMFKFHRTATSGRPAAA